MRLYKSLDRSAPPSISEHEAELFERAMTYLRKNFRTATLVDVAQAVGLSPFHFHRRFTLWAGRTPKTILTELQIEHAKALLLEGVAMPKVARQSGFAHQSHFTSRFHLMVGQTPGRWLRARKIEALDALWADVDAEAEAEADKLHSPDSAAA